MTSQLGADFAFGENVSLEASMVYVSLEASTVYVTLEASTNGR